MKKNKRPEIAAVIQLPKPTKFVAVWPNYLANELNVLAIAVDKQGFNVGYFDADTMAMYMQEDDLFLDEYFVPITNLKKDHFKYAVEALKDDNAKVAKSKSKDKQIQINTNNHFLKHAAKWMSKLKK